MAEGQKDKRLFVSAIILMVVHLAGIIGIHSSYKELFLSCTPVTLMLCLILLLWNHKDFGKPFLLFSLLTFLSGFFIEVAGVKTKMIFGDYAYGDTLGIKLLDVPLIIGVNWLLLVYCIGVISNKLPASTMVKSLFGAALLTATDLFIEVVAVKYDFWEFACSIPPPQNFMAWFVISFVLLLLFYSLNFNKENKLASILFAVQLIFFMILAFI